MSFSDISANFALNALLTWQNMDQLGENDAVIHPFAPESAPIFSAYLSANQSINSGTSTKITIDTEEFDPGSMFNTSLNRFVPTYAGKYLLIARTEIVSPTAGDLLRIVIYKNGSAGKQGNTHHAQSALSLGLCGVAVLSANGSGDYFEAYTSHDHGSARDIKGGQRYTYFHAFPLLSRT